MTPQLSGVEIFKVGTHNGDTYTIEDIDDMISAFEELDFLPALKLGHTQEQGAPAVGYVSRIWRTGNVMFADLVDIPERIFDAIKQKMFNRVSVEIWFNLERAGKTYRRALKALALLGEQIPGVAGLKPLAELFSGFEGETHISAESHFTIDEALAAASAALDQNSSRTGVKAMSEDAKKLVELEDQLKKLLEANKDEAKARETAEARIKVLELEKSDGKKKGDIDTSTDKLNKDQMAERLTQLAQQITTATEMADTERKKRQDAEAKVKSGDERLRKLENESRQTQIDTLAETCRIPALRTGIRQFADLATRTDDVHVFDANHDKKNAIGEVEALISVINTNAERLFSVISRDTNRGGKNETGGDASVEVDSRVKKYRADHPNTSYKDAMGVVLDADPQLKEEYAASA